MAALVVAAADRSGRLMADFGHSSVPVGIEIAPDGMGMSTLDVKAKQ